MLADNSAAREEEFPVTQHIYKRFQETATASQCMRENKSLSYLKGKDHSSSSEGEVAQAFCNDKHVAGPYEVAKP